MKPVFEYFGHVTTDLTECRVHLVDGELVAFAPKAWRVLDEQTVSVLATGEKAQIKQYRVTEWETRKIGQVSA